MARCPTWSARAAQIQYQLRGPAELTSLRHTRAIHRRVAQSTLSDVHAAANPWQWSTHSGAQAAAAFFTMTAWAFTSLSAALHSAPTTPSPLHGHGAERQRQHRPMRACKSCVPCTPKRASTTLFAELPKRKRCLPSTPQHNNKERQSGTKCAEHCAASALVTAGSDSAPSGGDTQPKHQSTRTVTTHAKNAGPPG